MMKNDTRKEFENEFQAWNWIHSKFVDKQWYYDDIASEKAGYNIYRDVEEYYNYICCLGDRLELNLKEGNQTINLWIKDDTSSKTKEETHKIEFNDTELILVKAALYRLSTNFNELDTVSGNSNNLKASISCLEIIKRINESILK